MKKLLSPTVCLALLLASVAPASAQVKIATINLKKVFDSYWKTKQADARLHDHAADLEKQHEQMLDSLQKARQAYKKLLDDANDQALSADERDKHKSDAEAKLRDLQGMESNINEFLTRSRTTLNEEQQRWREKILNEVTNVVRTDATHGGYTLVLDTAALSKDLTPIIVYSATPSDDLTAKVLSDLNADAPADLPKSTGDSNAPAVLPADKTNVIK
jgi:outer membrane protein